MLVITSSPLQLLGIAGASIASVGVAIFVNALWPNFIYLLTKRGRKPSKRHPIVWVGFWLSLIIACSGSFVAVIPSIFDNQPKPTPELAAQLLLRIGGFEIQIRNSGRSVATGIRIEVVGWQPGSPGVEIMERYSVPDLGPGSDFTLDRVLPPRIEPAPWESRSGYIMVTCATCDRPKGWAFYIPDWESGQEQQFFNEVSKSGSWPIVEFSYPDLKPKIGQCVNYPVGVCSGRNWIWNHQ